MFVATTTGSMGSGCEVVEIVSGTSDGVLDDKKGR